MELSPSQLAAAAADLERIYVEAGPGSGKTVVAASRFGAMRFRRVRDRRGVAALSFTRSATAELRRRIIRRWGPRSAYRPNRISTIDALFADMLRFALAERVVIWPNDHAELAVRDDWSTVQKTRLSDRPLELALLGQKVVIREVHVPESIRRIDPEAYRELISAGHCTHEDVRNVVRSIFADATLRARAGEWLKRNFKGFIVDEVFDANDLDLDLISLAVEFNIAVVLIGDPWQALYEFRGARPDLVPRRIFALGFTQITLPDSFRFTGGQVALTRTARGGLPVQLERGDAVEVDVVLCSKWAPLLDAERGILPLSLGGTKSVGWAMATLVLDSITFATLGLHALDLATALKRLALSDEMDSRLLRSLHEPVLLSLREGSPDASTMAAWRCVTDWVSLHGGLQEKPNRRKKQLLALRQLLLQVVAPTVGLSVHQAKGLEWDRVGLLLDETEYEALARGLSNGVEAERKLYVALTRARRSTITV